MLDHHKLPCDTFLFSNEWPKTPYLNIPEKERRRRSDWAAPYYFDLSQTVQFNADEWDKAGRFEIPMESITQGRYRKAVEEINSSESHRYQVAAFFIDWGKSPSKLKKQFADWVTGRRPPNIDTIEERGGGSGLKSLRADLKALGAYRLLKKMNWNEASDYTENKFRVHFYDNQSAWIRAKKEAENEIKLLSSKISF